jgi:hypothetical protein
MMAAFALGGIVAAFCAALLILDGLYSLAIKAEAKYYRWKDRRARRLPRTTLPPRRPRW